MGKWEEGRNEREFCSILFHSIYSSVILQSQRCINPWIYRTGLSSVDQSFSCSCEAQSTFFANSGQRITSAWVPPRENECQWLEWCLWKIYFSLQKHELKRRINGAFLSLEMLVFSYLFFVCLCCLEVLSPKGLIVLVRNWFVIFFLVFVFTGG